MASLSSSELKLSSSRVHHGILAIFCGSNRRRKFIYLVLVAFTLALLLFAQEIYASGQVFNETPANPKPVISDTYAANPKPVISDTYPANPKPVISDTYAANPPAAIVEPVVFTLIMWSEDSAVEGALLIKSILLYNSKPSDIHIICDDTAERILRSRLSLLQHPQQHVRVWFHKPSWQSMLDRVEREGSITTDHSAGLPGLMKLFIHEIMPSTVKKSIYIDTDAIFISDPSLLWDVFSTLRPSTAIVMASHPDQVAPEWNNASRICSCIMLLDLEKLRTSRLMDSSIYRDIGDSRALAPEAFRVKYGLPGGDGKGRYDNVRLGDQGYWWAIVDHFPDMFEPLSYDYEITTCLLDTYLTGLGNELITAEEELSHQIHLKDTPQEGVVVLPKLLHFNCLHGHAQYMEWPGWSDPSDYLTVRWGPALAYHKGFKWIWLNRGRKNSTEQILEIFTVSDILFADEIERERHSTIIN